MVKNLNYKPFGEKAILIEWEAQISNEILRDIVCFKQHILKAKNNQISDCIVGYHSLTILYVSEIENFNVEIDELRNIYLTKSLDGEHQPRLWTIPVCYDAGFGIDLVHLSNTNKLPIEQIIKLHSDTIYTVHFIGFLPGFLYLGGLDSQLHFPRKSSPRLRVKKGSVAIGGSQTGVYPQQSAGGWNIIGNTPIPFFNVHQNPPCFASSGDKIQFVPIDVEAYHKLEQEIESGRFHLKAQRIND